MKRLVLNWFFGRGVSKLAELSSKGIRHGIGLLGGFVAGTEYATQGQVDSIEAGALAGAAILWSIVRIKGPELIAKLSGGK